MRDSFEYEDYKQAPTLHTASALISAALDSHMQNLQSENGYLKYIATRPGAEKHGAHGLFGRQENTNLTAAMHDLTAHDGNVWTIIYSLHREDAERLEYNNAAAWRKLLVSQQNKFAEAFHVPASALHWYAAYHDADTHPHIHMMIWTDQETVLKRDAVVKLRSVMTNSIFQEKISIFYKDVTEAARAVMHDLVDCMEAVSIRPCLSSKSCWSLRRNCARPAAKSSMPILKSRSRTWWIPSWMNWKAAGGGGVLFRLERPARHAGGLLQKPAPSAQSALAAERIPCDQERDHSGSRRICGSRWSKRRQRRNRTLRRMKNHLRRKLLRTLLQIRRLQMKILRLWLLTLHSFHLNIF